MIREELFEAGLIERLEQQHGAHVDVRFWAAWVTDFAERKTVRNPSGMLVQKVADCARASAKARRGPVLAREELEHYAAFHVALFATIALMKPTPRRVAEVLKLAMADRYPRLNPIVVDKLLELEAWPGERRC